MIGLLKILNNILSIRAGAGGKNCDIYGHFMDYFAQKREKCAKKRSFSTFENIVIEILFTFATQIYKTNFIYSLKKENLCQKLQKK